MQNIIKFIGMVSWLFTQFTHLSILNALDKLAKLSIGHFRSVNMANISQALFNIWVLPLLNNTEENECGYERLFAICCHLIYNGSCFLAATKQLYKWYFPSVRLSVCLSVCLSHLFDYVPIIVSSWNFQKLLSMTKVRSMQKVKVRGQRSRSQRSQPNLTVSGL